MSITFRIEQEDDWHHGCVGSILSREKEEVARAFDGRRNEGVGCTFFFRAFDTYFDLDIFYLDSRL
jgi:hypothetical protein